MFNFDLFTDGVLHQNYLYFAQVGFFDSGGISPLSSTSVVENKSRLPFGLLPSLPFRALSTSSDCYDN